MKYRYFFIGLLFTSFFYGSEVKLPKGIVKYVHELFAYQRKPANDGTYGHVALHPGIAMLCCAGYSQEQIYKVLCDCRSKENSMSAWGVELDTYISTKNLIPTIQLNPSFNIPKKIRTVSKLDEISKRIVQALQANVASTATADFHVKGRLCTHVRDVDCARSVCSPDLVLVSLRAFPINAMLCNNERGVDCARPVSPELANIDWTTDLHQK